MANSHNVIIRGLNAIIQQAPFVSTSNGYTAKDVKDLLFYVHSWVKMVNHHHWVEESFIFPEIERFSRKAGLMNDPKHQHELFHEGMEQLLTYSSMTEPQGYRWEGQRGMKEIIDSFSQHLTNHLYAEIDVFLAMKDMDSIGLRKTWNQGEALAKQTGNVGMLVSLTFPHHGYTDGESNLLKYDVFPCVLGCADKTYEGSNSFPPLPWIMPYIIKYWFAAGNGAWRFNPCDWWGKPHALAFTPQGKL